jgi:hypothetical protein
MDQARRKTSRIDKEVSARGELRRYETENQNRGPELRPKGIRVRELRPIHACADNKAAQAKDSSEEENGKGSGSQASLAATLTFFPLYRSGLLVFARQPIPRQTTSDNLSANMLKTTVIVAVPLVVAERLLIQIPEQVEGFDADVRAMKLPFHEAPEVLHRVGVNVSLGILDGMIDDRVLVVIRQTFVREQFIAEDRRSCFNVFTYPLLKFLLTTAVNNHRAYHSATLDRAGEQWSYPCPQIQ